MLESTSTRNFPFEDFTINGYGSKNLILWWTPLTWSFLDFLKSSDDFFIVARIESFILGKGVNDALKRAKAYSKAGADAILVHSKKQTDEDIKDMNTQIASEREEGLYADNTEEY